MLSIGEFSKICGVSTKTLRYYEEIGLIVPNVIDPKSRYRYYAIEQLETMLFINRLKAYHFSLEEIKTMLDDEVEQGERLYAALVKKKKEIEAQVQEANGRLYDLESDLLHLKSGKSMMSYLDEIDVQLVEEPKMYLLSMRKMLVREEFSDAYGQCFGQLFQKLQTNHLHMSRAPMVLFHDEAFGAFGLDTEFAIPVKEYATGTRDFDPGLCLKTVLHGSYTQLSSVYAKQIKWADAHGYRNDGPLYEIYINDPSQVKEEHELVTEIYYPVKKK